MSWAPARERAYRQVSSAHAIPAEVLTACLLAATGPSLAPAAKRSAGAQLSRHQGCSPRGARQAAGRLDGQTGELLKGLRCGSLGLALSFCLAPCRRGFACFYACVVGWIINCASPPQSSEPVEISRQTDSWRAPAGLGIRQPKQEEALTNLSWQVPSGHSHDLNVTIPSTTGRCSG